MALSSSSTGERGVLGLNSSNGDTGDTIIISPPSPTKPLCLVEEGDGAVEDGAMALPSLISSFLTLCLRSWSLKGGRRGPMSAEVGLGAARRVGRVTGSLGEAESGEAPVRCWTTARKLDGSAWTKVVLLEEEEWSWAEGGEARLEAMGD